MKELKFADIGEGITEGHILKWLAKDGDTVKEDDPIVQIETDKAVVNLPAPASGTLKINMKDGSDIKVGDTLAFIGDAKEVSTAKPQPSVAVPAQKPAAPVAAVPVTPAKPILQQVAKAAPAGQNATQAPHEILATPSVRRLASQLKVDLA